MIDRRNPHRDEGSQSWLQRRTICPTERRCQCREDPSGASRHEGKRRDEASMGWIRRHGAEGSAYDEC